jgi:hypothetical protein
LPYKEDNKAVREAVVNNNACRGTSTRPGLASSIGERRASLPVVSPTPAATASLQGFAEPWRNLMSTIERTNQEPTATHRQQAPFLQRPAVSMLAVALLIVIGILRIVSTYHVFNGTIDEGAHLACGMQWFQNVYTYDQKHTPIARVSIALLPYLDGLRSYGDRSYWQEGVLLLSSGGHYWHNLTLARIGVLPYFVLAIVVVFLWTRRVHGSTTALIAAGIFSMLPVVLGHSAIATTDIPLTAFFLTAVYAFTRWLSAPSWRTSAGFGIATGLAIATKLSTLAFLPATMAGILPLYLATRRRTVSRVSESHDGAGPWKMQNVMGSIAIIMTCILLVIWAAYRFSHAPIYQFSTAPDKIATALFGSSSSAAKGVHVLTTKLQLPAPEFYSGLRELRDMNRLSPPSYMFGQVKHGGWWYFYPVAIAVKTPIAVLLLAIIGAVSLAVRWFRTRTDWQQLVPLVAVLAIFVIAAPSKLDMGSRHVMPIVAFLSMLAAVGAVRLWNPRAARAHDSQPESRVALGAGRAAVMVLSAWFIVSSVRAHPDYLSNFNELGGSNPSNILVISDLDWGQDLTRLATYLREQQVKHLSMAYNNYFDAAALGLPETVALKCGEPATGWVAIEEDGARVHSECYQWITSQPLRAYIGNSMRVYYLPEPAGDAR